MSTLDEIMPHPIAYGPAVQSFPRGEGSRNITGPSSDRSGGPQQPRYASYANPSEFRTSEISQRGSPLPAPPVAFRSLPPPPAPVR
jgi:hypothetical protein